MSSFDSVDVNELSTCSASELKDELSFRHLPTNGLKKDLIERLIHDNEHRTKNGTLQCLTEARLQQKEAKSKVDEVKQASAAMSAIPQNANEQNATLAQILSLLTLNQQQLSSNIHSLTTPVQMYTTNDTAAAIPQFSGTLLDSPTDWITEVERISSLALWSPELKLVNATTRLVGSARNWHNVSGRKLDNWDSWKNALLERFKVTMSFSDFIQLQARRILRNNETITEYIYDKNALLEKAPFEIPQQDRIPLILEGITDERWSTSLAVCRCNTIDDLIDHAMPLDSIRKKKDDLSRKIFPVENKMKHTVTKTDEQLAVKVPIHRFKPDVDDPSEQMCFRCKQFGHVSYQCLQPSTEKGKTSLDKESKHISKPQSKSSSRPPHTVKVPKHDISHEGQVNCMMESGTVTLIPVKLEGSTEVEALPDNGSVVTLIQKDFVPPCVKIYPWQKGHYKCGGNILTPTGWFTARIEVGRIDYIMPQIGICDVLPVPMILGRDWQFQVHATITTEPNGNVFIITPCITEKFGSVNPHSATIACVVPQTPVKPSKFLSHSAKIILPEQSSDCQDNLPVPDPYLTEQNKEDLANVLSEFDDVFASSDGNVGQFPDLELEIHLKHEKPISCKPYHLPLPERSFLKKTVELWMEQGICRKSKSAYAAPMFVVHQPFHVTTPMRPVVDYSRTINPITIPDPHPIDRMDDILPFIAPFPYKFLLDVYHAYHNIRVREQDVHKTAAVTPDYHIEFPVVMWGLAGGPAIMSRVIKATYGHLYDSGVRTYFDDVPGGAYTFDAFLRLLRLVFQATRDKGLKLKREKCIFAVSEIPLFGRILSPAGERPDPQRVAAVEKYSTLTSLNELRSFLGFANYFRKHLKNFAQIARPLNDLLKGQSTRKHHFETEKVAQINLDEQQQTAFVALKNLITQPPVLAYFHHGRPTFVETDASYEGLGACLLQEQNGHRVVIEYASRGLKDTETRYHINELEVTAVHWALVEKFHIYLLGQSFTLITDNFTTAYVVNKAKLNRKFARYVVDFAPYDFVSIHRPGKENVIADHLSRFPDTSNVSLAIVSSNIDKLRMSQQADSFCKLISSKLAIAPRTLHLEQIQMSYRFIDNVLHHVTFQKGFEKVCIVVPFALRSTVLRVCHDDSGHFDFIATLNRVRSKYWWKTVVSDTKAYTKACLTCARVNRRTVLAYGPMGSRPIPSTPWQIVSADHIVALPTTSAGNCYILVHIDHATRFVLTKPTCSLTASDVAHTLEQDLIYTFGPPLTYISDQGPAFTSTRMKHLYSKYGIEFLETTPYTPQSNGLVERANATIISTLKKFSIENPSDWDVLLPLTTLAMNTAQQKTTTFSPFYLLYGYVPRMPPNEIHFGSVLTDFNRTTQLELLAEARQLALQNIARVHETNKHRFDLRRIDTKLSVGDSVLYHWPQQADNKLTPPFKGPFIVVRPVGSVCYEIADPQNKNKSKVVHVQHLRLLKKTPELDEPPQVPFVNTSEQVVEPNENPVIETTRSGRAIKLPKKFKDFHIEQ